jgi:hypothetical protein
MRTFSILIQLSVAIIFAGTFRIEAENVMKDTVVGPIKIELHVLPAEPFFTADQVKAKKADTGMLIMGGAAPNVPDADPRPNHHLVVHVFKAKTGKAVTDAKVRMTFQPLDDNGNLSGGPADVPIVVMQAIGKGKESTHYGNNVEMPAGSYVVEVSVNEKKAHFRIAVKNVVTEIMKEMHMH